MPPPVQITPQCGDYPIDREFPIACNVDFEKAYCCMNSDFIGDFDNNFVACGVGPLPAGVCQIGPPGCHMKFPEFNDDFEPMYKTALGGTTQSAWVKIAFQQYEEAAENPDATWETILTMGNLSQPFNDEKCMATIKAFQYGWGTTNQGNRCRITILDQKGSSFQDWVQRMGINPEGDSVPVQGKYRMKVQFGWYTTGGAPEDICGQPPMPLTKDQSGAGILQITVPGEGFNSAFVICSPVMYFITDWINVHFENGKFIYELEGVDLLVRGQENIITETFPRQPINGVNKMYFTKAVTELGKMAFPPFRVEFKALDAKGNVVDLQFVPRPGQVEDRPCRNGSDCENYDIDCQGWGPYDIWDCKTLAPLAAIHEWLKRVSAKDQTGKITANEGRTGITMNYDPTYKFGQFPGETDPCDTCKSDQPQYGRLVLWANGIPYCQSNFTDDEINDRMKAVYVVNGGNCSPVLKFAPAFRWHSQAAQKAGGGMNPAQSADIGGLGAILGGVGGAAAAAAVIAVNQIQGAVKTNCAIASSPGPTRNAVVTKTRDIMRMRNPALFTQEATYHHIMTNLVIGAIEADLVVQGDPSPWLCTPFEGFGRCVGIVFVNPYFLVDTGADCPQWFASDPNDPNQAFKSICNELLTSKGWFIFGVDHQIKDGQYITTIKLRLVAPGAEINSAGSVVNLGAWDEAEPLPFGGQWGCLKRTLVGSAAAGWGNAGTDPANGTIEWIGGGTPCGDNYTDTTPEPIPPDD